MMVEIIKREPAESVVMESICLNCGVTLAYVPNDVKEDYSTDYTGDRDYFNFIICPNCKKRVKVRGY